MSSRIKNGAGLCFDNQSWNGKNQRSQEKVTRLSQLVVVECCTGKVLAKYSPISKHSHTFKKSSPVHAI